MDECKLYLIPESVLQSWQRAERLRAIDKPQDEALAERDMGVSRAVMGQSPEIPDYDKNALVAQRVGKFLNAKRLREGTDDHHAPLPPPPPPSTSGTDGRGEDPLLSTIPKTYRKKAQTLLKAWGNDGGVTWDAGNRVYIRGRLLPGANIADLVHHAVTRRKNPLPPRGFEPVRQYMEDAGQPNALYVNPQWHSQEIWQDPSPIPPPPAFSPSPSPLPSRPPPPAAKARAESTSREDYQTPYKQRLASGLAPGHRPSPLATSGRGRGGVIKKSADPGVIRKWETRK